MAETILPIDELVSDPNIQNGQVVIKDSQVRVIDVVCAYDPKDKGSAGKLAVQFGVHIGQVHAAMAWYYMHKTEFDEQIQRENESDRSQ
ncbi:MAG TPA: hypothetical protein VHD90_27455 [Phototrophicaceae bacterium]|nr:hypothetical protein [Phototrophicaceae bacterium]